MKLERWALFADVVSGFAVVITLLFLILGINENTRATYSGNYQLLLAEINGISLTVAQNEVLSALRSRWESEGWEALDESGALRIRNLERSLFRIYETAYYANSHGTLDVAEWIRFTQQICRRREMHPREPWEQIGIVLSDEFNAFIRSDCSS